MDQVFEIHLNNWFCERIKDALAGLGPRVGGDGALALMAVSKTKYLGTK
jgi:hypothetical protein